MRRRGGPLRRDDRAFSTVVEKVLAIGLVTLFVGLVSVTVYGGVVPDARTAAGEQLSERTLAAAAERIQQAVPTNATGVDVRVRIDLPSTIRGAGYDIRAENRSLVLDHSRDRLDRRARLALPESVVSVEGQWESGETTVVRVHRVDTGLVVRLESGER